MRMPTLPISTPNPGDEKKHRATENNISKPAQTNTPKVTVTSSKIPIVSSPNKDEERSQPGYVTAAIEGLSLVKDAVVPSGSLQSTGSGESVEDNHSHLSSSSTKQQSFDTKSMASVTTFAMDEKESIRPDDSASVRAAEDDEAFNAAPREESSVSNIRAVPRPSTSGVTIATTPLSHLDLDQPSAIWRSPCPNDSS